MFIMRTYYNITRLETDTTAFRKRLHEAFIRQYPDIPVTEQRIADQKRAIIQKQVLSQEILQQLQDEVRKSLNKEESTEDTEPTENNDHEKQTSQPDESSQNQPSQNSSRLTNNTSRNEDTETDHRSTETSSPEPTERQEQQNKNIELVEHLKGQFRTNMQKYAGMDPTKDHGYHSRRRLENLLKLLTL